MAEACRGENKRKHEDESPPPLRRTSGSSVPVTSTSSGSSAPAPVPSSYNSVPPPYIDFEAVKQKAMEIANKYINEGALKRPRVENGESLDGSSNKELFSPATAVQDPFPRPPFSQFGGAVQAQFPLSKKIEVPNGRVGVIIGRSGETIKSLVQQSGARIQVTRDADADPTSAYRTVELQGSAEQIDRAEQLIQDVLKEAETGGSAVTPSQRAGFGQFGGDSFVTKVPNNKVGLLIGKGGETIKNMQQNSGARIQIIPLYLPPGDASTERTVQINGTKEQVDAAKKLVNDIVNSENRVHNPQYGTGYRPPRPPTGWTPGPPPPMQQPAYGYLQPGAYAGQPQYNMSQPPYGGYPPSGGYQTSWDQSNPSVQQTAPVSGYDYYNQQQPQQQLPPGSTAPPDNANYSYGQPPTYPSPGSYVGDANYAQSTPGQQGYGIQGSYSGEYNAPGLQAGYPQAASNTQVGYNQQQGYASAPVYGATGGTTQDGATPYGTQGGPAQASSAQLNPSMQPSPPPQGYGLPQTSSGISPGNMQSGYGPPPALESGYGTQSPATSAYGQGSQSQTAQTQTSYGQPTQSQKLPQSPAVYGLTQQDPSQENSQAAPAQPGYSQGPQLQSQSGYSYGQQHSYGGAPPSDQQQAYGQQLPHQPYSDSYARGGHSQPPAYSSDGTVRATYDSSALNQGLPAGTKSSP